MDYKANCKQLDEFPSSFDLNIDDLGKHRVKELSDKLLVDMECGYDSQEETLRARNLLSYFYWLLEDDCQAEDYNQKVLEEMGTTENIVALSNRGHLCQWRDDAYTAKQVLTQLQKVRQTHSNYKLLIDTAKAELAFSYSRFGPAYYDKSILLFEEVVKNNPEQNLWKFGLGLVYRRLMHISANHYSQKNKHIDAQRVFDCFQYVAHNAPEGTKLKGRAWLELGELINNMNRNPGMASSKLFGCVSELNSHLFFEKALQSGMNDPYILQRCGRYFRYGKYKDLSRSRELLELSIQLKPTAFNYHHLAITIKMAECHRLLGHGSHGKRNLNRSFSATNNRRTQHRQTRQSHGSFDSNAERSIDIESARPHYLNRETTEEKVPFFAPGQSSLYDSGIESLSTGLCSLSLATTVEDRPGLYPDQTKPRYYAPVNHHQPTKTQRGRGRGRWNKQKQVERQYTKMIKSPTKIPQFPRNPEYLRAVDLLKKSIELSDNNNSARHDLGLLYIALEEDDKAVSIFKEITNGRARHCSDFEAARSYEQRGNCLSNMCYRKGHEEEKKVLKENAKTCFLRAMEYIAVITAKQSALAAKWNSFSTLKDFLQDSEAPSDIKLKEMAELHELVHQYGKAAEFYKQILDLEKSIHDNSDIYKSIVKNYVKIPDFDNALLFLKIWRCNRNPAGRMSDDGFKELYVHTHLEGSMQKLRSGDDILAREWYSQAYDFAHVKAGDEDDNRFDVAIFSNDDAESVVKPIAIEDYLRDFHLKVTLNRDDILPSQAVAEGYLGILKKSTHVVIVLNESQITGELEHVIKHAVHMHNGNNQKYILVVTAGQCAIPDVLATFQRLNFEPKMSVASGVGDAGGRHEAVTTDTDVDWWITLLSSIVAPAIGLRM